MTANRSTYLTIVVVLLSICVGWYSSAGAGDAKLMSKEELKTKLGDPGILVLDVRTGPDWSSSSRKIMGALRFSPEKFATWATFLPKSKTVVFY